MIDYAVRARLLEVATVTDLVGTGTAARIFPMQLPQALEVWPAITYQVVSGRPEYNLQGAAGLAEIRLQIDCWAAQRGKADAYAQVRELAEAVRGALSGYRGTVGGHTIQSCFLESRRVLHEPEVQVFRESLDFTIGYAEP